jgi:hypothetical protein
MFVSGNHLFLSSATRDIVFVLGWYVLTRSDSVKVTIDLVVSTVEDLHAQC